MRVNLPVLSGSEIGRPKYRRSNPILENKLYQYRQPIHDFYGATVNVAVVRQILFAIPQGQTFTPTGGAALTKTAWHTSMTQANLLPAPNKLYAKSIALSLLGRTLLADAERFLYDTLVQFNIDSRPFLETHAWKLGGGGGLWAGGSSGVVVNGWPSRENQFSFVGELGETIEQQQTFNVLLDPTLVVRANANATFSTATAANGGFGIDCFVHLDGLLNRGIL